MFRLSLAVAVLASTLGAAQAYVPRSSSSPDAATPSDLDHTYMVFFESGKANLTPQARQVLHIAASRHATHEVKVRVMVSTADGATALSQSRARAVRAELVRDGVNPHSIGNANRPEDVSYANADPAIRTWLGRSAVVKFSPLPSEDGDKQAFR